MLKKTLLLFLGLILIVGFFHNKKPLPDFVSYESPIYEVQPSDIHFFQDTTSVDGKYPKIKTPFLSPVMIHLYLEHLI